jgi:hypothetical protein
MTIHASGTPIKFSEIAAEFGLPSGRNIGAYRISQSVGTLSNLPLDTGVPQSGQIKFSDFYSKRLNVVVDFYSIGDYTTRVNALDQYNNGSRTIIGGFNSSAPVSGANTKVIINVNRIIGSEKGNRNYVALKTGNWGSDAQVSVVIGPSGRLTGAGGDGGYGGFNGQGGTTGGQGTSALGIQYPTSVINQGTIFAGRGGGGGGGGAGGYTHGQTQKGCRQRRDNIRVGGGGGGGGAGYPSGNGGSVNGNFITVGGQTGQNGGGGSLTGNGGGGAGSFSQGGNCVQNARGGAGGGGEAGGQTSGEQFNTDGGGGAGDKGYAIIIDSSGSLISFVGNGTDGDVVNGPTY